MAAPNIVNVTTITGVTTFIVGVSTIGSGNAISTVVSNPASSGKVLKINSLVASSIGSTTGITINYYDAATHTGAANTVSLATTASVPTYSSLVVISKENSIYIQEGKSLGAVAQSDTNGTIDIVCSYEEIS